MCKISSYEFSLALRANNLDETAFANYGTQMGMRMQF